MIVIIASSIRERTALAAICGCRDWLVVTAHSVRAAERVIHRYAPRTVVVRHKLSDGFSDHVLSNLATSGRVVLPRSIVLLGAGTPADTEVRQIALGADCVLRDPVRTEVLLAYIERFQKTPSAPAPAYRSATAPVAFAGGTLHRPERRLQNGSRFTALAPKEMELIEMLLRDAGHVVTYETLYCEILNRGFDGETVNLRVLLGKLCDSARSVGIGLRNWIEVVPKSGYRYFPDGRPAPPTLVKRRAPPAPPEVATTTCPDRRSR